MTIAQIDLRIRQRPIRLLQASASDPLEIGTAAQRQAHAFRRGFVIIGALTAWFFGWLTLHWVFQPRWLTLLPGALVEVITLVETAGAFSLSFLWAGLGWRYWLRSRQQTGAGADQETGVLSVDKLQLLSPEGFERYVAGLFRQKGYTVVLRGSSGDLGVDLELTGPHGRRAIVQCKRYQHTIGAEIVRELYGTLMHEGVMWGFLVTTADISDAAREWATGKPLTLIDGVTLVEVSKALRQKNR